jgi:hypothetical protein
MKYLFVIAVKIQFFARYKHEISLNKYGKTYQKVQVIRYNCDFVITVMVITEFDSRFKLINILSEGTC